ncbi:MAG: hypothetical protein WA790_05125 [Sulfitobacter sp.]
MRATQHIAVVALSLNASVASAAEDAIPHCANVKSSHSIQSDHIDYGDGVVSFRVGSFGYGVSAVNIVLSDCESGSEMVATTVFHDANNATSRKFNVAAQTKGILDNAATSERNVSFKQIGREFKAAGADVKYFTSDVESCACRAAYPELVGSKWKYDQPEQGL